MTPEQIEEMNELIKRLATELLAFDNRASNLVAYVNDLAAFENIASDDLKNAYTSIANVTAYLNNGTPSQGNWRGNLNKVTSEPIV
jgi:ATP/maltotriose-dependent transcriptional regulator MalT